MVLFKKYIRYLLLSIVLTSITGFFVFPVIWSFLTALKAPSEVFTNPFAMLPRQVNLIANVQEVLERMPFPRYLLNTIIITFVLAAIQIALALPAGYAFARLQFPGRDALFILFLTRLVIAPEALFLPNYVTIARLKLLDTYLAVMLPYFSSAVAVFLFRNGFRQIPQELEDAARLDGCTGLRFIIHIGIPLIRPAILAFAITSLVYHWNAFFWPLLVTSTDRARTLTVGLALFGMKAESGAEWALTMTATWIVIGPLAVAFLFLQTKIIGAFIQSGLKG